MSWVLERGTAADRAQMGGKAAALAELTAAGFEVPAWFVVTPAAFEASLEPHERERLASANSAEAIRACIERVEPTPYLRAQIETALTALDSGEYAVRSSAADEDGAEHSFAGQLDSFLFVAPNAVAEHVARVWRSGFSERVLAYRRENDLPLAPRAPAVLIQRMVDAERAGVAFSVDPVSGRRSVRVVAAVHGLGSALVSGEADADTWRVAASGTIESREIVTKSIAHRKDPAAQEGVSAVSLVPELQGAPALTDEEILAVAELASRAENYFGRPQDIEWAIADGRLYLLQSRPITSLAQRPDPDGERVIWDNSNIAESYGGVTTPLTFSFARRAYEEVYRQFCRMLAVPASKIEAHDNTFRHMLGLIRGRVYYNLLNWYRVLALLPGFTVNRTFMEQMMGVKEPMPQSVLSELESAGTAARALDALYLARSVAALGLHHVRLPRNIRNFYERLNLALAPPAMPLEAMRADQLAAAYRELERRLLTRWDAPLVNDFFAMIFYGMLRKLAQTWCGDTAGTLQNDLLCGEGGMISAEPAKRVKTMAQLASRDPALVRLLNEASPADIRAALPAYPKFNEAYQEYLARFGDRCMEELKLESATLHDDPLTLFRAVGQLATHDTGERAESDIERKLRAGAETRVATALAASPVKRRVFAWVLANARARVRDRENLRFERTRLFGRVRRLFVELGRRLYAHGALDDARDVFYLEVEEILGWVEGSTTTSDFRALVALRRREFDAYRDGPAPADRFETFGAVHQGNTFEAPPAAAQTGEERRGIGCCPGLVRGPVRVIRDPRGAVIHKGEILVAERTDPGWIMLFPACSGLLVERGSLLSHSAIVAREMGIPAIVSLPGVTRWLSDGDWVELDGAAGIARRIAAPPAQAVAAAAA
ncbi:MAG TPA: PEP/pyruvate-binding domain-containing protein [Burkholderiales bacterium]|nr:PEP/pyruvate-binding domain-containing protein [Burkholderiales bacterium]